MSSYNRYAVDLPTNYKLTEVAGTVVVNNKSALRRTWQRQFCKIHIRGPLLASYVFRNMRTFSSGHPFKRPHVWPHNDVREDILMFGQTLLMFLETSTELDATDEPLLQA
jgi:hypothetical protein